MTVEIEIPDAEAESLRRQCGDLSRMALEGLAVEGYRGKALSAFQVRQMLGHSSRWETIEFLSAHGVWPNYDAEDLRKDMETSDKLFSRAGAQ